MSKIKRGRLLFSLFIVVEDKSPLLFKYLLLMYCCCVFGEGFVVGVQAEDSFHLQTDYHHCLFMSLCLKRPEKLVLSQRFRSRDCQEKKREILKGSKRMRKKKSKRK